MTLDRKTSRQNCDREVRTQETHVVLAEREDRNEIGPLLDREFDEAFPPLERQICRSGMRAQTLCRTSHNDRQGGTWTY